MVVSLYAALSRKAEIMIAEPTGYTAANVNAPNEQKLGVMQACSFLDKLPVIWLCGFAGLTSKYVCCIGF